MAQQILISTTGTLNPVVFNDLGKRSFSHPTTNYNLASEFTIDEINNSADVQTAITGGFITLKDENGSTISSLSNNYYLTRNGGDFDTFTLKGTPVNGDLILIEDSAASGSKKYITAGSLSSTGSVFGNAYSDGESAASSSTTSSSLQTKLSVSYTPTNSGKYRLFYYAEVSSANIGVGTRVVFDFNLGTMTDNTSYFSNTAEIRPTCGHDFWTLVGGTKYTVTVKYCRVGTPSSTNVSIRNCRMELYQVST